MFTKTFPYRSPGAVFVRGAYYVAADIKSHRDLKKLDRWFLGSGICGVYSLHAAAQAAERRVRNKRGARRTCTYVEVIVSTPVGVSLFEGEDRFLAARIVDDFQCVAAMVGAHWHNDGRVDLHVLLLNETVSGYALGTKSVLPSTGRIFRNIEVVARQFIDAAHDDLNLRREKAGRPRIQTMDDRRGELYRQRALDEAQRIDDLVRRSAACAKLLERSRFQTPSSFAVTANDGGPIVTTAPGGPAIGTPAEVPGPRRRAKPPAAPVRDEQWHELTALLYRWTQLLLDAQFHERHEIELGSGEHWFADPGQLRLRPEIEAALAVACERCIEDAIEARETLRSAYELFDTRFRELRRDHDLDLD